jgi:hypothetical protein
MNSTAEHRSKKDSLYKGKPNPRSLDIGFIHQNGSHQIAGLEATAGGLSLAV